MPSVLAVKWAAANRHLELRGLRCCRSRIKSRGRSARTWPPRSRRFVSLASGSITAGRAANKATLSPRAETVMDASGACTLTGAAGVPAGRFRPKNDSRMPRSGSEAARSPSRSARKSAGGDLPKLNRTMLRSTSPTDPSPSASPGRLLRRKRKSPPAAPSPEGNTDAASVHSPSSRMPPTLVIVAAVVPSSFNNSLSAANGAATVRTASNSPPVPIPVVKVKA